MTNFPWLFSVNQTLKTTYYCLKSNYIPFKPCQWLFEIVQCEWKFLSNVNMWYSLKLSKEHRGYPRNIYLLGKIVISLNYKFHSEASIIFKYWINRKKNSSNPEVLYVIATSQEKKFVGWRTSVQYFLGNKPNFPFLFTFREEQEKFRQISP